MNAPSPIAMGEVLPILLIMVGFWILPLLTVAGLALTRRFEHAPQKHDDAIERQMDQLESRLASLEASHDKMARMQERLDFMEAVLEGVPPHGPLPASSERQKAPQSGT